MNATIGFCSTEQVQPLVIVAKRIKYFRAEYVYSGPTRSKEEEGICVTLSFLRRLTFSVLSVKALSLEIPCTNDCFQRFASIFVICVATV